MNLFLLKHQRIISAYQLQLKNTLIPDIDHVFQLNVAKLSNNKSSTVYNYSMIRNSRISYTIKRHYNQMQIKLSPRKRQFCLRLKTQPKEDSRSPSFRKSIRTSSMINGIKKPQVTRQLTQLIFPRNSI